MAVPLTASCAGNSISNILEFSCFMGRRSKTDVYASNTGTLTIRKPEDLPAAVVLGANIAVDVGSGTYKTRFSGYVTNVNYSYGIQAAYDTATIELEGYLSYFGRNQLNSFALAGATTGAAAQAAAIALSGTGKTINTFGTFNSVCDSTTFTGNAQNLITSLVAMEQGRLVDRGSLGLRFLARDYLVTLTPGDFGVTGMYFTDSNPGTAGIAYNQIQFSALSENYYTQVTVQPNSVAQQTAGTGSYNYVIQTYDATTTQALNLANYILAEFNSSTKYPTSLTTKLSLTSECSPAVFFSSGQYPGTKTSITFRGTTYQVVVEGLGIYADTQDVYFTPYFSGFSQNNFLILDDTVYGKLDTGRLGF